MGKAMIADISPTEIILEVNRGPRRCITDSHSFHKIVASIFSLFALLLFSACSETSVAEQPKVNIAIAGSTSFSPVLFELTEAFSERHPNVVFDVRGGGSSFGESQLAQGKIDLAALSYLIEENSDEPAPIAAGKAFTESLLIEPTPDVWHQRALRASVQVPLGLDGVAMIVNRNNPIDGITLNELRDIYSGRIFNWSELGSEAGEIQLVIRESGSGIQRLFESRVMHDTQVSLTAVVMPTNADVLSYVALYPSAIGYVSRSYVTADSVVSENNTAGETGAVRVVPDALDSLASNNRDEGSSLLKRPEARNAFLEALSRERRQVSVIAIDNQTPTFSRIVEQQYYLIYPLYLTAVDEPTGWLSVFIDFVLSPSGQEIVSRYHVPVR